MLSRFGVKNYKSLVDVDIPMSKIHALIGQNDSGKTSLLEAIYALCRSSQPEMSLQAAFEGRWEKTDLVYMKSNSPKVSFSSQIDSRADRANTPRGYGFTAVFQLIPGRNCTVEREWYEDKSGNRVDVPRPNPNFTSVAWRHRFEFNPDLNDQLKRIGEALGAVSFYRFEPKLMAVPAAIDETRRFRMDSDGFGLATLLDDILGYNAERFLELSEEFCQFFPEFRRVRIQTEMAWKRSYDPTGLHNSVQATGKGTYFETRAGGTVRAQQASDGAVLFLGFLSLLYLPEPPKVLLIEEPEKGVYPKRLEEIVSLLKRAIIERDDRETPQIIFTTHSPYVLSQFTPDEVTLMSRRDGYVIARPLRDAPHIIDRLGGGEFYLGELWYNLDEEELFQDAGADRHH